MAGQNYAGIVSDLATLLEPRVRNQINDSAPFLNWIECAEGQAHNINFVVRDVDGDDGYGYVDDGEDVSTYASSDGMEKAVLPYSIVSSVFSVTGFSQSAAVVTGQINGAILNLFQTEGEHAVWRLTKHLGSAAFLGDGTASGGRSGSAQTIAGLATAVKSTGSYATINRSTSPLWAGNELLNGGTPRAISLDLLRAATREVYESSGEHPDAFWCHPVQWAKLNSLYTATQSFLVDPSRLAVGDKLTYSAGGANLAFDGVPIMQDINCPKDKVYALTKRHLKLRQMPDSQIRNPMPGMGVGKVQVKGTFETQMGGEYPDGRPVDSLSFRLQPLAVNGDTFKFQLIGYFQMECDRPGAQAVVGDLQTSYAGL